MYAMVSCGKASFRLSKAFLLSTSLRFSLNIGRLSSHTWGLLGENVSPTLRSPKMADSQPPLLWNSHPI